jgi:hypothetical protein
VEGPHDAVVIRTLLYVELQAARAHLVPLFGTRDLESIASAQLIFDMSDAEVLVVVDNGRLDWLRAWFTQLRTGSPERQRAVLAKAQRQARTNEERKLVQLASAAAWSGHLDRLELHPLGCADIAHLLPVEMVVPGYETWERLRRDFLAYAGKPRMEPGDGGAFKDWVNTLKGGRYTAKGLGKAARVFADEIGAGVRTLPIELRRLAKAIEEAGERVRTAQPASH